MRRHEKELKKLDLQVVVVTFQSGPIVEAYARETRLAWPILIDTSLEMYQAYGMNRGTLVEHFRTDGLVGLCEAAVTGPASPGAEWRCQPTGR